MCKMHRLMKIMILIAFIFVEVMTTWLALRTNTRMSNKVQNAPSDENNDFNCIYFCRSYDDLVGFEDQYVK